MQRIRKDVPATATGAVKDIEQGFGYSEMQQLWNELDAGAGPLDMRQPHDIDKWMVCKRFGYKSQSSALRWMSEKAESPDWIMIKVRDPAHIMPIYVLRKVQS